MKYLALLRGINVGGNNIIKKDRLQSIFKNIGCESVKTYIQSGNILFKIPQTSKNTLIKAIQKELKNVLDKEIPVVIYTEKEYLTLLEKAPTHWGEDETQKHNALFIIEQPSEFPTINSELEQIHNVSNSVIFWSGSKEHYSKTTYAKDLSKSPLYKRVTIRNANTTLKLKELFQEL